MNKSASNNSSIGKDRSAAATKEFASSEELLLLLSGLLAADTAFHDCLFSMREKSPDWEIRARERLSKHLADLIGVSRLETKIEKVASDLKSYQSKMELRIADFLPEGDLKKRFESEFPEEKRRIAEFVAESYFVDAQRCFMQASTFLLHLAESLHATSRGRGSVIHTNSTVFPWLMLGRDSKYSVYATCGQIHDPLCCGWLFTPSDSEARKYVESIFRRTHEQIDTAFITPQHITLDGKLHFALEATAELVEVLVSAAPTLVILSPMQRVRRQSEELRNNNHSWYSVDVPKLRKGFDANSRVELVLAGEFERGVDRSALKTMEEFLKVNVLSEKPVPTNGGTGH